MKSLILFFALASPLFSAAQKISFGVMIPFFGFSTFPVEQKPFTLGYNLAPSINFVTNKTHHHIRYSTGNNNIDIINGFFFKSFDLYCFYTDNLNSKDKYLGFGIEKGLIAGKNFLIFPFAEVGTNFEKPILSFGVVFHPFLPIGRKK